MTALILHPHTISDLTLTSVRRNNVLELAQSIPRTKSSNFNNKKQQQKNTPSYSQRQGQHYGIKKYAKP